MQLKNTLLDVLDEIALNTETKKIKTCTRCKKEYDSNDLSGCKKHASYYVGGTLIAGRWTCCRQLNEDAIGCINTSHTDKKITWTQNPDYGTYDWIEA